MKLLHQRLDSMVQLEHLFYQVVKTAASGSYLAFVILITVQWIILVKCLSWYEEVPLVNFFNIQLRI